MLLGLGAFGAMAALPLGSMLALLFGVWVLRDLRRAETAVFAPIPLAEMLRYSAYTAAGLIGFALLINMDAILVKRFFDPVAAGNYGTAVTLGKIIQFFPIAIIMILFPKAARRRAEKRDTRAVLFPALFIVAGLCGLLALIYFLIPDLLIRVVFGPAYSLPPNVLGLIGLAMMLLSLANVWLNYYLSIERTRFVYLIWTAVISQFIAMFYFHDALWQMPLVMAVSGLWLTAAGTAVYLIRKQW
jgi:O-antigen/teichoic acid export membrane protein